MMTSFPCRKVRRKKSLGKPMDIFEVKEILSTFQIIKDTREQNTPKAAERYASFGVPYQTATLSYGDYCGTVTLPGGQLYDISVPVKARCCVERKMNLDELASCFTRGRDRFAREFQRAQDAGAKVYLLVENASWEAIQFHRYKSRFSPAAFMASLMAWTVRYDITPVFCRSQSSGQLIKEILYRDMKERLENGEIE